MNESQAGYFAYLNEVGSGKPNLVVDVTVKILQEVISTRNESVVLADFGCYNGAMLSRIRSSINPGLSHNIQLIGYDSDEHVMSLGAQEHPEVNFRKFDLFDPSIAANSCDVGILSNVLHEVYSACLPDRVLATHATQLAFYAVAKSLRPTGMLIFTDGMLPPNPESEIQIEFSDEHRERFLKFADFSNYLQRIEYLEDDNHRIVTLNRNLAYYLTKQRYMNKPYWDLESTQVYPYFTEEEMRNMFTEAGLSITRLNVQPVNRVNEIIVNPDTQNIPPKNVLIIAQKPLSA